MAKKYDKALLRLDQKLIIRNARPAMAIFLTLLMMSLGLVVLVSKSTDSLIVTVGLFHVMILSFPTTHGLYSFSYESGYFNFLLHHSKSLFEFIYAKYVALQFYTLLSAACASLYLLKDLSFLGPLLMCLFFNCGISVYLTLNVAMNNYSYIDLQVGPPILEGHKPMQYIFSILIIGSLPGLFWLTSLLLGSNLAYFCISLLSLVAIVFRMRLVRKLAHDMKTTKYEINENFLNRKSKTR